MDEKAADGDLPAHWVPQAGVELKVIAMDGHANGILVSRADAHANVVQYNVPLEAGVEYRFTAQVRGEAGAQGCIYVERSEPYYWCMLTDFSCTGNWQEVTVTGIMPDQGSQPYAVFRAKQGSTVEFASPVLEVMPGILQNGMFAGGAKCWTLENAVVEDSGDAAHGKLVRLDGTQATARIWQSGVQVKAGQLYKLEYDVRGGTDRQFQDIQGATWFRVAAYDGDNLLPGNEIWQDSFASWQHKSLTFTPERDMEITVVGELKEAGTVFFDNIALNPSNSPVLPVEMVLDYPWGFHDFAVIGTSGRLSGAVFLGIPAATVRIAFNGESLVLDGAAEVPFDFALPAVLGEYPLEATAYDSEGQRLASDSKLFRVIPTPTKAEGTHVVTFDANRVMHVDGEPFFPIGSWNVFGGGVNLDHGYEIMAKAGFNLVLCLPEQLDMLSAHGLLGMVQVPSDANQERTAEGLAAWAANPPAKFVRAMRHPSTIAWFSTDEPAWGGRPVAPYRNLYRAMTLLDPTRPVFLNEAPRGKVEDLRPYANVCDLYGVDIYPIPSPNAHSDLADKTMTSVGKYTDICQEVVRNRKPIWMTLQGFAWGQWNENTEKIYPSRAETRFMIYEAIAHGATGLMYWGTMSVPGGENHPFYADLAANLLEVESLGRYLVGETVEGETIADHPAIRICQKRTAEGDDLWIVLNESSEAVKATLGGGLPARLRVVGESRVASVNDGKLVEEFAPYGLHVYRDAARPMARPLKKPAIRRLAPPKKVPAVYENAAWVWYPGTNQVDGSVAYLRQTFQVKDRSKLKSALLAVAVDDYFKCFVNGQEVMRQEQWTCAWTTDVIQYLHDGENEIIVKGMDAGEAPCGALFALKLSDGTMVCSGDETQASLDGRGGWGPAEVLGAFGCQPWRNSLIPMGYYPAECDRDFEKEN